MVVFLLALLNVIAFDSDLELVSEDRGEGGHVPFSFTTPLSVFARKIYRGALATPPPLPGLARGGSDLPPALSGTLDIVYSVVLACRSVAVCRDACSSVFFPAGCWVQEVAAVHVQLDESVIDALSQLVI